MPARSNDFQALVYFIRKELGGDSATVTESASMLDPDGEPREIDILIEGSMAGEPMKVAIECKDTKRKQTVQWIEEMEGKYRHSDVNKTILVSRSGFTEPAHRKAKRLYFETLTFEEAAADDAGFLVLHGHSVELLRSDSEIDSVEVVLRDSQGEDRRIEALPDNSVHLADGTELGKFEGVVAACLDQPEFVRRVAAAGPPRDGFLTVSWRNPLWTQAGTDEPREIYFERIDSSGLHMVVEIHCTLKMKLVSSKVTLRAGRLGRSEVAWGTAPIGAGEGLLVLPEPEVSERAAWLRLPSGEDVRIPRISADAYERAGDSTDRPT